MVKFRQISHLFARALNQTTRQATHKATNASSTSVIPPTIPKCPSPRCKCAELPPDLDIDRKTNLNGAMALYNQHVLVFTGQADWKSRIEDEDAKHSWGSVIRNLKKMLGPKGNYYDPTRNVIISATSFTNANPTPPTQSSFHSSGTKAILFPSFQFISDIEQSRGAVQDLIETQIVPNPEGTSMLQQDRPDHRSIESKLQPISAPTILICSHNSRDSRCGILGPLLHAEFASYINKRHALRTKPVSNDLVEEPEQSTPPTYAATDIFEPYLISQLSEGKQQIRGHPINVGMISHIGGHKWAGNVIIYLPPDHRGISPNRDATDAAISPLAGKGIWYGRVEPKHVEGIVEQTIGRGNIIEELFRGGVNHDQTPLRL